MSDVYTSINHEWKSFLILFYEKYDVYAMMDITSISLISSTPPFVARVALACDILWNKLNTEFYMRIIINLVVGYLYVWTKSAVLKDMAK